SHRPSAPHRLAPGPPGGGRGGVPAGGPVRLPVPDCERVGARTTGARPLRRPVPQRPGGSPTRAPRPSPTCSRVIVPLDRGASRDTGGRRTDPRGPYRPSVG